MKKFMKAIAFVTVMCMALSTVAFAAGSATLSETEKVLNISVTGAGDDQVALVVTASDATDLSNPLYIDQKGAVDGTASFTAVLTNYDVDAVDVYVGYATYAAENAAPEKIGEDVAITNPITEVTISKVAANFVEAQQGAQQVGEGAALTVSVEAPEGVYATNMIWAIRYMDGDVERVKYTESFDISDLGLGTVLTGDVKLGLAFLNGFNREGEEIASVEITDVDAIFMFTGEHGEKYTNADDAANKAN